jgi:hypothetical protein
MRQYLYFRPGLRENAKILKGKCGAMGEGSALNGRGNGHKVARSANAKLLGGAGCGRPPCAAPVSTLVLIEYIAVRAYRIGAALTGSMLRAGAC